MAQVSLTAASVATSRPPVQGDDARLKGIFEAQFDFIWRYLRRLGLSDADADDGAQQAFLVLARRLDDVPADKGRAFLCGTAQRIASDMRKRAWRRYEHKDESAIDTASDSVNPETLNEQQSARAVLDTVLDGMPIALRSVFVLFELEEMTTLQIANSLDLPPGTVASRLRRARETFRNAVKRLHLSNRDFGGNHD